LSSRCFLRCVPSVFWIPGSRLFPSFFETDGGFSGVLFGPYLPGRSWRLPVDLCPSLPFLGFDLPLRSYRPVLFQETVIEKIRFPLFFSFFCRISFSSSPHLPGSLVGVLEMRRRTTAPSILIYKRCLLFTVYACKFPLLSELSLAFLFRPSQ